MTSDTREKILLAAKERLHAAPIADLRVSDVCKAAGVDRSTFYYYFKDKYELALCLLIRPFEGKDLLSEQDMLEAVRSMRADRLLYSRFYEDSGSPLQNDLFQYFYVRYSDLTKEKTGKDPLPLSLDILVRTLCYTGIGISKELVMNKSVLPDEEMIHILSKVGPPDLQKIYFPERYEP